MTGLSAVRRDLEGARYIRIGGPAELDQPAKAPQSCRPRRGTRSVLRQRAVGGRRGRRRPHRPWTRRESRPDPGPLRRGQGRACSIVGANASRNNGVRFGEVRQRGRACVQARGATFSPMPIQRPARSAGAAPGLRSTRLPAAIRLEVLDPSGRRVVPPLTVRIAIDSGGCAEVARTDCAPEETRSRGSACFARRESRKHRVIRMRSDDGYVTLAVLLIVGLLAAIVSSLLAVSRPALGLARIGGDEVAAEALIQGGVATAGYLLFAAKREPARVNGMDLRLRTGDIRLTVADEAGRIDLNAADPTLLAGLYSAAGGTSLSNQAFAARVVDWRDTDGDVGVDGAEAGDYSFCRGRLCPTEPAVPFGRGTALPARPEPARLRAACAAPHRLQRTRQDRSVGRLAKPSFARSPARASAISSRFCGRNRPAGSAVR